MYFEELGIDPDATRQQAREMARGTLEQRLMLYLQRFGEEGLDAGAGSGGMPQSFIDGLDRVNNSKLNGDCPICACDFKEDKYPLVVALPCPGRHQFDLECVGPWLQTKSTCPMCRHDFTKKKPQETNFDQEIDDMYG